MVTMATPIRPAMTPMLRPAGVRPEAADDGAAEDEEAGAADEIDEATPPDTLEAEAPAPAEVVEADAEAEAELADERVAVLTVEVAGALKRQ